MILINQNMINKSLLIVFCVVFLKVISCTAEVHGRQIHNSTSDLSHQLYDDDDDSNIDQFDDGGDEEVGGGEEVQGDEVSEDYIQEYRRGGGLRREPTPHRHYKSHRGFNKGSSHGHGKLGSSHGKRRSIKKTSVTMPSGTKYYITRPDMTKWHCGTRSTPTKLITLNPNGKMGKKEYDMVAQEMKAAGTGLNYQIVKIEKVINGCFWRRYRARQSIIHGDGKKVNERMLFHGSKKMSEILKSGFDERHAASTGAFGPGIYFSPQSSTSNMFTGAGPGVDGKMLLCRVTVGNLYKAPTYPDRHSHAPPGYHSVGGGAASGDLNNEVIVYRGEQAYAEYMITYKL